MNTVSPSLLLISAIVMFGSSCFILCRRAVDQMRNAFIGRLMWSGEELLRPLTVTPPPPAPAPLPLLTVGVTASAEGTTVTVMGDVFVGAFSRRSTSGLFAIAEAVDLFSKRAGTDPPP